MAQYSQQNVRELSDQIDNRSNSDKWSSRAIYRTHRSLPALTRLKNVRNSRLAINKLAPDILYIIFTLVVYCPEPCTAFALRISHVCHHWRKFALEWPVLWAFLDLNNSLSITELFMKRSQNASLTLIWTPPIAKYYINLEKTPSNSYFVSHAKSILSRLHSLRIHNSYSNFISLYGVVQDSILLPLQLRSIALNLLSAGKDSLAPPPLAYTIDNSYLQEITLCGLNLPWPKLPHNRLTHFYLGYPTKPPGLSELLSFLSNCSCLKTLRLDLDNRDYGSKTEFVPMTLTGPGAIQSLDLPNLTELELGAEGSASYDYIWQFAWRIRSLGALSSFQLFYDLDSESESSGETIFGSGPFQIFGAVPPGTFTHFSHHEHLSIIGNEGTALRVCGHRFVSDNHGWLDPPSKQSLLFTGNRIEPPFNYSSVLELLYAMPHIRHLTLGSFAWKILALPNIDLPKLFPRLRTLAFTNCSVTEVLDSLRVGFRVKRLIFARCTVTSFKVLFFAVGSTGAKILELVECQDMDADGNSDAVVSALREWGVEVIWTLRDFKFDDDPDA